MQRCARCGTPNEDAAGVCASCGALLMGAARDPYAELAKLDPPRSEPTTEQTPEPELAPAASQPAVAPPQPEPTRPAPAPRAAIPEWVLPGPPPAAARDKRGEIPPGRAVRFVLLLVAWIALFHVLPAFTIYSTSPGLKEAISAGSLGDYVDPPTCRETAEALQQDATSCADPNFSESFARATSALRSERNRIVAIFALAWGMLAIALLVLIMGAGLRAWWWLGIFATPVVLFVEGWALWRLSAYPVRYWERA
jgi:hypothetical protein